MIKSLFKKKKSKQPAQKTDAQIKREERIKEVSAKSGLSEKEAKRVMEYAKNKYGILYGTFSKNEFWKIPDDDRDKAYCDYLHGKKKLRTRCLEMLQKTGLSESEAEESLRATKEALGITNQNYLRYEFYKLTPEKQRHHYRFLVDTAGLFKGKRHQLENSILHVTKATGWNYKTAKEAIRTAQKEFGITPREYFTDKFYLIPEGEKASYVERIFENRRAEEDYKKASKDFHYGKEKREETYAFIMEKSGWHREEAEQHVKASGYSLEDYALNGFWDIPEDKQSEYCTTRLAALVREKYSVEQRSSRTIMYFKDLFFDAFGKYLGRTCMSTAGLTYEAFAKAFEQDSKIIFKPRLGYGGHGIQVYDISKDTAMKKAFDDISQKSFGVVEAYITQHPQMKELSQNSVNTIRLVTIRTNNPEKKIETGKVHFVYAALRMSLNDSSIDNLRSGGAVAAVDMNSGKLVTPAVTTHLETFEVHPITGRAIKGFQIPFFTEAKQMVEEAMIETDLEGYYGWDVAITEDGPIIIEGNNNPDPDVLQLPYIPQKIGMRHVFDEYLK